MSESGDKRPDFLRSESERLYTPENLSISTTSLDDKTSDLQRDGFTDHRRRRKCRNRKKERLNTQLLDAAQTADLEKCTRLVEEGADVNALCRDSGATALMVSAAWGHANFVSFLLEKGASPIIRDKKGLTPAHVAAARGEDEVLRVLLDWKDADHLVNSQVEIDDLHDDYHRCSDSWIHQHETLLPNMPSLTVGSTPLHAASQWSHSGCVKLLLDKGADTEICDSRGLTPLDVAGEIVHIPDDCPHHEEGIFSLCSYDDLPSRPKASAFVGLPVAFGEKINEEEEFDRKPSTRHVIEEIEAFRKRLNTEDIRKKPFITPTPEIIGPQPTSPTLRRLRKLLGDITIDIQQFGGGFGEGEPTKHTTEMPEPTTGGIALPGPIPGNISPLVPIRDNIVEPKDKKTKRSSRMKKIKNCLHTAVKEGDENLVRYLISEKPNYIFHNDENGCTPAHIAVEMMDLKILSILLNINEAVNVQDSEGRSLLYRSAELDWVNGVDFLLNANVNITTKANDGSTVLHIAARKSNSDLLEELFTFDDAKKVINEFDKKQQTPLCCAVEESSIPCVEFLLDHEACATVVQQGELTLLHIAAKNGCKEIMELLLKSGANILLDKFSATSEGGMTPLHVSSKEGHADCVKLLVHRRANIFNKTTTKGKPYYGATPLHLAARYGRLEVAEVLIKFDKDVLYQRNSDLWQPLHVASRFGKTELVRLLLKLGGNLASEITLCDGYRKTALDMIVGFIPQPVEFLQEVFDSFIYTNDYPLTHVECVITFKYDLFSPSREENRKQLPVLDTVINSPKIVLQEILLLHPLAETFLFLKWQKLRVFFFLIFAVYCVLTLSITTLSLMICTDVLYFMPSNLHFYRFATSIPLVFLATQEVFQASRLQRYYWTELESWVKWATFVLAGWLSLPEFRFNQGTPICFTNISSVAVLLSWVELLLLLSRLPNWGFSVLMFCKVAQNVLKVLATFAILFIGFMFSLMIEFRSESPFINIWQSFTKVIVMTSEIEYSDMFSHPAESGFLWSIVARSILLSFVILVTIVLMNLMVGIAVNDITLLEAQGRTRRLAKQVSFLSLIEMFVYSGYLLKVFPNCLKNAIKKRRKVPLNLQLRIGKPHKHDMKIFPVTLRNSIMEKVSNIKKTDDKSDLKDLNDKIDKLIKQQKEQIVGSLSSLSTDDTIKHRNVTLSMLKQVAFSLQEVKTELNKLKSNFEPRSSFKTPKRKDTLKRT